MVLKYVQTNAFVKMDMLEMLAATAFLKCNVSSVLIIKSQK